MKIESFKAGVFCLLGLLVVAIGGYFLYPQSQDDNSSYIVSSDINFAKRGNLRSKRVNTSDINLMFPEAKLDFSYDRNVKGGSVSALPLKRYDILGNSSVSGSVLNNKSLSVGGSSQTSFGVSRLVSSAFSTSNSFNSLPMNEPFASAQPHNDNLYDGAMTRWGPPGGLNPDPGTVLPIGSIFPLLLLGAIYLLIKMLL